MYYQGRFIVIEGLLRELGIQGNIVIKKKTVLQVILHVLK